MSKASKRRLERRKRLRRGRERKRAIRLRQWASQSEILPPNARLVTNLGGVKMSEVLVEFAEPLLADAPGFQAYHNAIQLAAIAWNIALLPPERRREFLAETVQDAFGKGLRARMERRLLETLLDQLVARKERRFAHIRRFILDVKVSDEPEEYNVSVLSTVTIPPKWSPEA